MFYLVLIKQYIITIFKTLITKTMFFELLLDLFWIIALYAGSYHLWHIFLDRHSNVLKDLFNINVRYHEYNREQSTKSQHEVLYTLSTTVMVCCMVITPLIHSIMYLLFYSMIDVVKLNTILLTVVMAKILWYFNIREKSFTLKPWKGVDEAFLATQLLFISVNYDNITTAIPTLFQIIDELSNLENVFITMSKHYTTLFNTESALSSKITDMIIRLKTNKVLLSRIHIGVLSFIVFISILYSNLKTNGEIVFYYYAIARILQINYVG